MLPQFLNNLVPFVMLTLQVKQLTKTYNQRTVFKDFSFEHTEGVLGISGANGSGKSTLMKCLAQLLRPKSGSIIWKINSKIVDKSELRALISYTAPYINLYGELTSFENLDFIREVNGKEKEHSVIDGVLEFVQMREYKDQLFKQLSTGQQQRIKLASALVTESKILFLDEPGSNLDEKGHQLVADIVKSEKSKGTFVILATNDPKELELCDVIISMNPF